LAISLFQQVADQEHPFGYQGLSLIYNDPENMAHDYSKAAIYLEKSAQVKHCESMLSLANLYP